MHLRSIQCHMAQGSPSPASGHSRQDLNRTGLEWNSRLRRRNSTDAAVVGLLDCPSAPKGQVLVAGALDLAGEDRAHAVGVRAATKSQLSAGQTPSPQVDPWPLRGWRSIRREIQFIYRSSQGNTPGVSATATPWMMAGGRMVCSGCQGRKDLGFSLPKFIDQIH